MKIFNSIEELPVIKERVILTIGTYDGIHKGHTKVLKTLKNLSKKENAFTYVLTFSNLPFEYFNPYVKNTRIIDTGSKIELLKKNEIDGVILIDFSENFAKIKANEFLNIIKRKFVNLKIVVGYDFRLGKDTKMDSKALKIKSEEDTFDVEIIPPVEKDGLKISSTRIRSLIRNGNILEANKLLGRPFSIEGKVEPRDGKGSKIGFPTANIRNEKMVYPLDGVYFTGTNVAEDAANELGFSNYKDKVKYSITFVGKNTLAPLHPPAIETYIFNFDGNIYNKNIKINFYQKIRDTKYFKTYEALKAQIEKDIEHCLKLINNLEEINAIK